MCVCVHDACESRGVCMASTWRLSLQHNATNTATLCKTHCSTLQHPLQHSATPTATLCNSHCNTLSQTATHTQTGGSQIARSLLQKSPTKIKLCFQKFFQKKPSNFVSLSFPNSVLQSVGVCCRVLQCVLQFVAVSIFCIHPS